MASAFMHADLVAAVGADSGTSTTATASMPLSNLTDPQPRLRTRLPTSSATIQVDFGTSVTLGCVALISTNLTAASTVTVTQSNNADMSSPTYAPGSATTYTSAAANGNVVLLHATAAAGRYLRLVIADASLTYIDVGRLVAGPLWSLTYAWAYGIAEGRAILDRRDRNPFTGAEFPVPAVVNPRTAQFSLPFLTGTEAIGEWRTMLATLGAVGDALWVPETSLSQTELNQRCLWGAIAQPGESALLARANFLQYQRAFTLVERV